MANYDLIGKMLVFFTIAIFNTAKSANDTIHLDLCGRYIVTTIIMYIPDSVLKMDITIVFSFPLVHNNYSSNALQIAKEFQNPKDLR